MPNNCWAPPQKIGKANIVAKIMAAEYNAHCHSVFGMVAAGALTEEKKRNGKAKSQTEIRNQSTKQCQSNQAHGAGNMCRYSAYWHTSASSSLIRPCARKYCVSSFAICSIGISLSSFALILPQTRLKYKESCASDRNLCVNARIAGHIGPFKAELERTVMIIHRVKGVVAAQQLLGAGQTKAVQVRFRLGCGNTGLFDVDRQAGVDNRDIQLGIAVRVGFVPQKR